MMLESGQRDQLLLVFVLAELERMSIKVEKQTKKCFFFTVIYKRAI